MLTYPKVWVDVAQELSSIIGRLHPHVDEVVRVRWGAEYARGARLAGCLLA